MTIRKHVSSAAFCAALLIVSAGCAGGGSATDGVGEQFRDEDSQYLEEAISEGEVLWYTAALNTESAETVKALFEEAYPEIEVQLYRQTAQRVLQRFTQETENGSPSADLLGITEMGTVEGLAKDGQLQKFVPQTDGTRIPEFAAYDDDEDYYHTGAVGSNVIIYNTNMVDASEVPTTWQGLLDPKWKGQLTTGHPGASGYVGTWATWLYLTYGDSYLVDLQAQEVLVGQSVTDTVPRVLSGERAVGVSSEQTAGQAAMDGGPIGIIYPDDGAVLMPSPNAIPAQAAHPNAGKLLAEFILSVEVQEYLAGEGLLPVIEEVDPPDHLKESVGKKFVRPDLPLLEENLQIVIARWQALFGA